MKLRLAVLIAALAAAACSPAPAEDGPAPSSGAAAKRMPLPDCASVETQDAGAEGWKHPDCRKMLTDQSKLAIEARYTPAEDDTTTVKVQVVAPGDARLQTIEETMGNTFEGVKVVDIDVDGREDLLVPLETGNVNTSWALWMQTADGKSFVRAGEPSGVGVSKTESGYISVPARSSANEWGVTFYKLEGGELKPVVTADVIANGEPAKMTGVDCTVTDAGGLASTGLDAAAAQKHFCAEPSVADIFKP
jgi:hypothetical protein